MTMKINSLTKRLATALAVAGGLTLAGWAQAQDIYFWDNFSPPWGNHSSLYPNWNSFTTNTSAVNFNTFFNGNDTNSGMEVISTIGGYGSGYADLNNGTGVTFANADTALATNDTACTLTFTVNPTPSMAASGASFYTNYNWIGLVFILNLDSGIYTLANNPPGNNYSGWNNPGNPANYVWSGSNVVVTWDLSSESRFLAYTQGGTNHFYGCNLGIDPAVIFNAPNGSSGHPPYNITFNSITFAPALALPPNLSISHVGTNVIVFWPTGAYTLQQNANMAKFSWSPWGFPYATNNGTNSITIPAPANTLFFRLSNP
jgi:hypothetical protein